MTSLMYMMCANTEDQHAFLPQHPHMRNFTEEATKAVCTAIGEQRYRWRGEVSITRRQYSLWIGHIFIGEVVFDRAYKDEKPWRVELSTQKYLKTMGRYKTEIEAHDALLDAAVDALLGKAKE